MANVTQTDQAGAAQIGTTPRDADDSSDNMTAGAFDHNEAEFSANEKGELVSRLLYHERQVMARAWSVYRMGV